MKLYQWQVGLLSHADRPDHLRALTLELSLHVDPFCFYDAHPQPMSHYASFSFFFCCSLPCVTGTKPEDIVGLVKLSDLTFDARALPLDY